MIKFWSNIEANTNVNVKCERTSRHRAKLQLNISSRRRNHLIPTSWVEIKLTQSDVSIDTSLTSEMNPHNTMTTDQIRELIKINSLRAV